MKFKICHDPSKKTLSLPRAALQLSGLADAGELTLHTEAGCVVVARNDLTTAETVGIIRLLNDLNVSLIFQLVQASREAAEEDDTAGCEDCERGDCIGLAIPSCLLEQADIGPDDAMNIATEDGRIIITTAEEADPLDELDPGFLAMLANAGVELDGLRYLLEQGDERDE
ncbi:AbrB/MazE/SpoVT family DNA-binding domain-containing protein [Oscillibacter sp.]|uniref:AbrB/MazE/SpoVT family DNA-binding domain-containing protein n=1 Tax=Oscillibacter sp. TaxID=1945593 RepID=UPI001B3ECC7B|nr:hypothetical protein [Oscillibacter sp.]MBP3509299.1 hypothetical protein [Oscillibacter sp.]